MILYGRTRVATIFFIAAVVLCSCRDEGQPGYNQAINPLWEHNFNAGMTGGIVPIVHNEKVIFLSEERKNDGSANDKLIALDKNDATLLWEWSDHFESSNQHFDANSLKPIYQDVMAITIGGRNFAINLLNGQTVWKNRNKETTSRSSLSNIDSKLFRTDITSTNYLHNERIMEGDFRTGQWKPIYEVDGGVSIFAKGYRCLPFTLSLMETRYWFSLTACSDLTMVY